MSYGERGRLSTQSFSRLWIWRQGQSTPKSYLVFFVTFPFFLSYFTSMCKPLQISVMKDLFKGHLQHTWISLAKNYEHDEETQETQANFFCQWNHCIFQMELPHYLYSPSRSRREEDVVSPRRRRGVVRWFLLANVEQESKMDRSHKHIL